MKKVGIIVAMEKEWNAMFGQYGRNGRGMAFLRTNKGNEVVAKVSGIGKVNAAITAYRLWKEYYCSTILSFGCAGGADYSVKIGDVIVGDEFMYYDVDCGAPNAVGQVQGCPGTFPSSYKTWPFLDGYRHGLIATGDSFVESETLATSITKMLYPAHRPLAFDMESAAIAQVCNHYGIGFTSVRVISDNPISGERTYKDFWEKKDITMATLFKIFMEEE